MRKHYTKFIVLMLVWLLVSISASAESQKFINPAKKAADLQRNSGQTSSPSILAVGADVVIKSSAEQQTDVKIAVAYNGWMYAVFTAHGGAADSIFVVQSKDHGVTWQTLIATPGNYYSSDIIICGNDTNALDLFYSSILYDSGTGMHTFMVNKNNGLTGAMIGMPVMEGNLDSIYDGALAHDFQHPATGASPYSVEAVFSKHSASEDSVIALLSVDGGTSFADRKSVDVNTDWFGKLAVAYGYSPDYNSGRYFVAYEQHLAGEKYGHVKLSRTDGLITDPFTAPAYIDSVNNGNNFGMNNACNPSISIQNSTVANDSNGLSAVVIYEDAYNASADIDCIIAYSLKAWSDISDWRYGYANYLTTHTLQPDICYDETNNKFLVTYWDSTNNQLRYRSQGFNMPTPLAWPVNSSRYNDQVGTMVDPFPQIAFDPLYGTADFVWNEIRSTYRTALFDAENSVVGIPDHASQFSGSFRNYPNPANDLISFSFNLEKSQDVLLEAYDVVGNRITMIANEKMSAGLHQLKVDVSNLPAGFYTVTFKSGNVQNNQKLLIVH